MMRENLQIFLDKAYPKISFFGKFSFLIIFLSFYQFSFSKPKTIEEHNNRVIIDSISNVSNIHITGGATIIEICSVDADSVTHHIVKDKEKLAKATSIEKKIHRPKKEKSSIKNDNGLLYQHTFLSTEFLFDQNSHILAVCITPVNYNTPSAIIIKPSKIAECFLQEKIFSIFYKTRFFISKYSEYLFTRPPPYQFS